MVNQEWLQKKYYKDENGNIDPICHALDCFEQVEYQVLKKYKYNYWTAFCNSITLTYVERQNRHIICLDNIEVKNDLFKVKVYKDNIPSYFQIIKENLDSGLIVGFETMFDLLLPYAWYSENAIGEHNGHMGIIVSYNDMYYYVVDNPDVLVKERAIIYKENSDIILIPHDMLHTAFEVWCVLATIEVREEVLGYPFSSISILKQIVENYYKNTIWKNENEVIYKGRIALERIYENLISNNYIYLMKEFFKDHWNLHLIMSRHIILLNCLLLDEAFNHYYNAKIIIKKLRLCIEAWEKLKTIVFKNHMKPISNLREHLQSALLETIFAEDEFFSAAKNLKG